MSESGTALSLGGQMAADTGQDGKTANSARLQPSGTALLLSKWYRRWRRRRVLTKLTRLSQKLAGGYR